MERRIYRKASCVAHCVRTAGHMFTAKNKGSTVISEYTENLGQAMNQMSVVLYKKSYWTHDILIKFSIPQPACFIF